MIDALSLPLSPDAGTARSLLSSRAAVRDDESRLAAALRPSAPSDIEAPAPTNRARAHRNQSVDPLARRVATEIVRIVEARLPGRIRDLEVRIEHGQFVLAGVSSSYYVKQVAQHLAMHALDSRMLGKLINEIDVRPER